MRRRALLSTATTTTAAALALGTAGCLTADDGSDTATTTPDTTDTGTRTDADTGTRTDADTTEFGGESTTTEDDAAVSAGDAVTVAGVDLELGGLSLQSSFVEHIWPTWNAVAADDGLYAVLSVTATDSAPFLSDDPPLWAVVDDDRWTDGGPTLTAMNAEDGPERFAVPVPTGRDLDDVAIAIGGTNGTAH